MNKLTLLLCLILAIACATGAAVNRYSRTVLQKQIDTVKSDLLDTQKIVVQQSVAIKEQADITNRLIKLLETR